MIVRVSRGRGTDALDRHQNLVTGLSRARKLAHSSSQALNIAQHLVSAQIFSRDLRLGADRDAAKAAGFACARELTAGLELANQRLLMSAPRLRFALRRPKRETV